MPFTNEDRKRFLFAYWDKLYREALRTGQMAGTGWLAKVFQPRPPAPAPDAWNPMKKCPPENIQN